MDSAQFKKWLSNHTKRFNSIEAWLNKKPETPGGEATAKEIIEAWFQVLADVRIDDAIWATEQMFKGDLAQPQGPGFDDHPRTVRRYALERAKGRSGRKRGPDGTYLHDCPSCEDTGFAMIWCPPFLEVIRELFGDNPPVDYFKHDAYIQHPNAQKAYKTTAAACHCAKGQQKAADAKRALLVYDPARHTLWRGHTQSALRQAVGAPVAEPEF
jgi:hypothetical protein